MTQSAEKQAPPTRKPRRVEERCMAILTLGFLGGVLLYTFLPEGIVRVSAIAGFSCLMTFLLFRFGLTTE
jgi:hypothetical protein